MGRACDLRNPRTFGVFLSLGFTMRNMKSRTFPNAVHMPKLRESGASVSNRASWGHRVAAPQST